MFNENFSFGSSPDQTLVLSIEEYTSAEVSPFTSRCSSPYPSRSQPSARRDSRFDVWRAANLPRHPSITALTAQLQSQALSDTEMRSPSPAPSDIDSVADSTFDTEADEGYCEGPDTPATTISDFSGESNEFDPTLWDLSMSDTLASTSSPRPSLSLEAQALSSYTMRRRQRQALVRLQCLATRAPDLAMLIEECHPSSLPFDTTVLKTYGNKGRSESNSGLSSGPSSGRIEKDRNGSASVRKAPRMRKRTS